MRFNSLITRFFIVTICAFTSTISLADVIRLNNGGEVRGKLEGGSTDQDQPLVIRTLSGAIIEIDRADADFVQGRSELVEQYVTRTRTLPETVEAHWQLAEWCRAHLLKSQRTEQLNALLDIDPDHEDARKLLRHVKHQGQWMPYAEMMADRGYVRHKNKWITTQELALIDRNAKQREAEIVWYPKVRLWLGWVLGSDQHRRNNGLENFQSLDEPNAIPALMKMMANHKTVAVRQLYVKILGNIPGEMAVEALLDRYLFDQHQAVWSEALAMLTPPQYEIAIPMLISALTNDTNSVIQRAATALGATGSEQAVPALIAALVTTHKFRVPVVQSQPISFGTSPSGQVGMLNPRQANATASADLMALARLGQLPFGAQVVPFNNTPKNVKMVTVKVDIKNASVLSALESITDKNFGFYESDWHLWWSVYKS